MSREVLDTIVQELYKSFEEFHKGDAEKLEEMAKGMKAFITSMLTQDELKDSIDKMISITRKESIKNFRESFENWSLFNDLQLSRLEKDYVTESLVDKINQGRATKLLEILTV